MAKSYINTIVNGHTPAEVAEYVGNRGSAAFVSPQQNGYVVIYDRDDEILELEPFVDLTRVLSADLKCVALTTVNREGRLLWYLLYDSGRYITGYDSRSSAPVKVHRLCATFGAASSVPLAWLVLKAPRFLIRSELTRHKLLARILRLPAWSVGTGYESIESGKLPDGLSKTEIIQTGTAQRAPTVE